MNWTIYVEIAIGVTTLIVVLWQNRVLKTQVSKQSDIIRDMEAFSNLIDLEKVKKYVSMREQTISDESKARLRELELKYDELHTDKNDFEQMTKEQASLLLELLIMVYDHKSRTEIVETFLPVSKRVFIEVLKKYETVEPTAFNFRTKTR